MNQTVEDITLDPTHGILAPRAEISTSESRPSFTQQLIQHLQNCKPEPHNRPQPKTWEDPTRPNEEPAILPTLQAKDDSAILSFTPPNKSVIPTEGGAFASAVERQSPYFAFAVAGDESLDGGNVSTLANLPVGSMRAVGYSTRQNYNLCDEAA